MKKDIQIRWNVFHYWTFASQEEANDFLKFWNIQPNEYQIL